MRLNKLFRKHSTGIDTICLTSLIAQQQFSAGSQINFSNLYLKENNNLFDLDFLNLPLMYF